MHLTQIPNLGQIFVIFAKKANLSSLFSQINAGNSTTDFTERTYTLTSSLTTQIICCPAVPPQGPPVDFVSVPPPAPAAEKWLEVMLVR